VRTSITVFDETRYQVLEAEVLDRLSRSYSNVEFMFNQEQKSGQGYYSSVRFQMYARDQAGTDYFIVDGGFTDWTQKLLSNRKERLLISGMGSERSPDVSSDNSGSTLFELSVPESSWLGERALPSMRVING
jgi:hypothetical protein